MNRELSLINIHNLEESECSPDTFFSADFQRDRQKLIHDQIHASKLSDIEFEYVDDYSIPRCHTGINVVSILRGCGFTEKEDREVSHELVNSIELDHIVTFIKKFMEKYNKMKDSIPGEPMASTRDDVKDFHVSKMVLFIMNMIMGYIVKEVGISKAGANWIKHNAASIVGSSHAGFYTIDLDATNYPAAQNHEQFDISYMRAKNVEEIISGIGMDICQFKKDGDPDAGVFAFHNFILTQAKIQNESNHDDTPDEGMDISQLMKLLDAQGSTN